MSRRLDGVSDIGIDPGARRALESARTAYGTVPEPMRIWAHSLPVLRAVTRLENDVAATWRALDQTLVRLAVLRVAQIVGCPWCIDFGTYLSECAAVPTDKLAELGSWEESTAFDELERLVLEYAEAMTTTPPAVSDELFSTLMSELDVEQITELTMFLALENMRSRFNHAVGLTSQGYRGQNSVAHG